MYYVFLCRFLNDRRKTHLHVVSISIAENGLIKLKNFKKFTSGKNSYSEYVEFKKIIINNKYSFLI